MLEKEKGSKTGTNDNDEIFCRSGLKNPWNDLLKGRTDLGGELFGLERGNNTEVGLRGEILGRARITAILSTLVGGLLWQGRGECELVWNKRKESRRRRNSVGGYSTKNKESFRREKNILRETLIGKRETN